LPLASLTYSFDEGFNFAGVYFTAKYYDDVEWVDVDSYDLEKIWEDDEIMDEYRDELHQILMDHKEAYENTLEDVKENPENYEDYE